MNTKIAVPTTGMKFKGRYMTYLMRAFGVNFSNGDLRSFPSYPVSVIALYSILTEAYLVDRVRSSLDLTALCNHGRLISCNQCTIKCIHQGICDEEVLRQNCNDRRAFTKGEKHGREGGQWTVDKE